MRDFLFLSTHEWVFLASVLSLTGVFALFRRHLKTLVKTLNCLDLSDSNTVRVSYSDNFHNYSVSESYSMSYSGGSRSALRAAKRAINDDLCGMLKGNGYISGQELYDLWCTFGETPRVDGLFFNAYGYARRRAIFYAWRKRIFLF